MSLSDFTEEQSKEPTWTAETQDTTPTSTTATATPVESTDPTLQPEQPAVDDVLGSVLDLIGDIGSTGNFKMMVFGPPGNTKSSFIASAPNNLIYDFENGLISAKASPNGIGEGTQAMPFTNVQDFSTVIGGFMNNDPRLSRFKVFSIDTLSDLHKRFLTEVCQRDHALQPSRNPNVPVTEQYTEVNERIIRVVRTLRDLPLDIIITSHSKTVEPKNAPSSTYADFSESLSNRVMAMMDIVGYLQFKEIDNQMVPVLQTTTDGHIRCKTRIPLPAEIINPTYGFIRQAWEESKNK